MQSSFKSDVAEPSVKLFEGERLLVITGILGFILSAGIALFIFFQGRMIPPEGNLGDAFSFNAATIGIFILSIAAILPFARFRDRKRKAIRWLFIISSLYGYAIETVQNFRGFNPRFTSEGSVIDAVGGLLFGITSIILVIITFQLAMQFLRMKYPFERPLLILGIRYAFISVLLANLAGIWMIVLQGRFTGDMGNLIVLHGIGFHALQTLIIPAWILEKIQLDEQIKRMLIHYGCIAWLLSIIFIGFQTILGRTVFELTALPIISGLFLAVWFSTALFAAFRFIKIREQLL